MFSLGEGWQPLHQGFFSASKCVKVKLWSYKSEWNFWESSCGQCKQGLRQVGSHVSVLPCAGSFPCEWCYRPCPITSTVLVRKISMDATDGAGLPHFCHWTGNEGCAGRCSWSWDWRVDPALDVLYRSKDTNHHSTLAHKALRKLRHPNMGWSINSGVILFSSNTVPPEFFETYSAIHSSFHCKTSDF